MINIFIIISFFIILFITLYWYVYVFSNNTDESIEETTEDPTEEIKEPQEEVFNVYYNQFTYNDSEEVCNVFNSSVATYEQVLTAYNDGAEWCNYGWSDGGLALYPMQSKKDSCGNIGVNGGYFDPTLEFGVNCYGIKPDNIKYVYQEEDNDNDNVNELIKNGETVINYYNDNKWSKYD